MQKSSFLFAVAILLLSFSPCADAWAADDCQEHFHITLGDEGQPETDNCNPFCSCACCSVSANHETGLSSLPTPAALDYSMLWHIALLTSPPFNIWQPPRVWFSS